MSDKMFTEVLKKELRSSVPAIHLTATKVYVGDGDKIVVYNTVTRKEVKNIAPRGASFTLSRCQETGRVSSSRALTEK